MKIKPKVKKYADGGKNVNTLEGDLYSKVLMNRNKNLDFVQRANAVGQYPESNMFQRFDPNEFGQKNSQLMGWGEDDNGQAYMSPSIFNDKNEAIKVPNQYADYISSIGYKHATGIPTKQNGGSVGQWEIIEDLPKAGDGLKNYSFNNPIPNNNKNIFQPIPQNNNQKSPLFKNYNNNTLGYNYQGTNFDIPKTNGLSVGAGIYSARDSENPNDVSRNPYVSLDYNFKDNHSIGAEYQPGWAGVNYTYNFKNGEKTNESLNKYADGGRQPIRGTLQQYQNYQDSLRENTQYLNTRNRYINEGRELFEPDDFLETYSRIPSDPQELWGVGLMVHKKPVQPIIFEQKRPKQIITQIPLQNINSINQDNQQLNFNPIPFKQGTYFTKEISNQNESISKEDMNKKDYFSKTGKPLGRFGSGGITDDLELDTITRKQNIGGTSYTWNNNKQKPNYSITSTENNNIHGNDYIDPTKWLKTSLDVTSLFSYPLSVVGAAKDAYEGDYLGAGLGLIPVLGKAGLHGSIWKDAYTVMRNKGVPEKIAQGIKKYGKNAIITSSKAAQGYDFTQDMQEKQNGGKTKSNWEIIE